MFPRLINHVKTEKDSLALAVVIMVVITLIFTAYVKFMGLPMTRARNSYNEAVLLLNVNAVSDAESKLLESLEFWHTDEAINLLQELRDNQSAQ